MLARLALKKGAKKVVAVDINPAAVGSARRNAPWSEGEITRDVHRAVFENGVTARFLQGAASYLAPGGAVWLQYCDASKKNFPALQGWIAESGYSIQGPWSYGCHDLYASGDSNVILYKLVPVANAG